MILFPVAATLISLAFGVHLLLRFARRGNPAEGLWSIYMLMYAAASGALALRLLAGWSSAEFRVYWLFGAVLTVPYLAVGEVYFLVRRQWIGHLVFVALLVATAWATSVVRTAPVDGAALAEPFPLGKEVFGDGTAAHRLAQYYSWPAYLFLLGGVLWSAVGLRGRPELRHRFIGVVLIAVGATVVAAGSGIGAGLGNFAFFSVSLAVGVAAMYWGFLVATRPAGARMAPG